MKNASAPVLSATGSEQARMSSVQARPSPATSSGWATMACQRRTAARSNASPVSDAPANRAIARAMPCRELA